MRTPNAKERSDRIVRRGRVSAEPLACCGVYEAHGISERGVKPIDAVVDLLCEDDYPNDDVVLNIPETAHIIFTQATGPRTVARYGWDLEDYIVNEGLGTVVASNGARNPNTSNYVTVFVWTLNRTGIKAWAKRNKIGS